MLLLTAEQKKLKFWPFWVKHGNFEALTVALGEGLDQNKSYHVIKHVLNIQNQHRLQMESDFEIL